MKRREEEKTELWAVNITVFLLLIFSFLLAFLILEGERQKKIIVNQHKAFIQACVDRLLKDCSYDCRAMVEKGDAALRYNFYVSKECEGKKLKSVWLSTSFVKAYYNGRELRWIEVN